ncbi:MAG: BolA family transcriptional regulator [Alphaproteobacteria bacterium]|nr:BolA family transcriptional regulator [Alphaproteobacteria bacterium]
MSVRDRIIKTLEDALTPFFLRVEDFSERHAGHSGYREGGGSHFDVLIVADAFENKSLTERHRIIYTLLDTEIKAGLHALKLKTLTVAEAKMRKMLS